MRKEKRQWVMKSKNIQQMVQLAHYTELPLLNCLNPCLPIFTEYNPSGFHVQNNKVIAEVGVFVKGGCLMGHYVFHIIQMSSRIKTHRRNQAQQHCQEHFRLSTPTIPSPPSRLSSHPSTQLTITFRSSDITQIIPNVTLRQEGTARGKAVGGEGEEGRSSLMSTFRSLQEKLAAAKKQLQVVAEEGGFSFQHNSFQLNSFKASSSSGRWAQSLLDKQEDSTINLESQKQLMDAVRSKERIVWVHKIKGYYLSEVSRGVAGLNQRALQHLSLSHQILRSCPPLPLPQPPITLSLPQRPQHLGRKTLVLDLDQTLFHCAQERESSEDMEITLSFDDTNEKGFVSIRPFAISFLKRMGKHFEIVAFTASERCYADTILDELDPDCHLIHHRLYREHCTRLNSKIYAKDLRILGRDLSQVILVDNSPFSSLYQLTNAVPILPYYSGQDVELLALEKYLELLRKAEDVREVNRGTFQLHRYSQFEDCEELVKELYYK